MTCAERQGKARVMRARAELSHCIGVAWAVLSRLRRFLDMLSKWNVLGQFQPGARSCPHPAPARYIGLF